MAKLSRGGRRTPSATAPTARSVSKPAASSEAAAAALRRHIRDVPDFPRNGILFRDITPLLHEQFSATLDALEALFSEHEWSEIEALAGVESRGFVLAAGLAARRGKGFVPVRKQGKLPPPVVSAAYALEYGSGVLEMQRGADDVFLIDDVLATGGTMQASAELCGTAGYRVRGLAVLIDLRIAGDFTWNGMALRSLIRYD
jgi:adenine phosphoribosyltransferase